MDYRLQSPYCSGFKVPIQQKGMESYFNGSFMIHTRKFIKIRADYATFNCPEIDKEGTRG